MSRLFPTQFEGQAERDRLLAKMIETALDAAPYALPPRSSLFEDRQRPDSLDTAIRRPLKALASALQGEAYINVPGLAHGLKIIAEAKPADPDFQHRFMMAAADVGSSETLDGRLNPLRGAQRAMAVLLDRLAHDLQNSSRGAAPPATAPLSQRVAGAVRNVLRSFDLKRSKAPSDIEVSHAFCEAAFQAALLFGQPHAAVEPKLHKILDPVADLDTPAEPLTIRHAVVRLTALASQIESIKEPQSTFVFIDDVAPA